MLNKSITTVLFLGLALGASFAGVRSSDAAGGCTMVWMPVCAAKDGVEKTYTNKECAKVDGAKVVRVGRCEDPQPAQAKFCPTRYDPVCATKNGAEATYSNTCFALADGAQVKYKGKCGTDR